MHGSSGEGIRFVKLKSGSDCMTYGGKVCDDGELLDMTEACDSHAVPHTVSKLEERRLQTVAPFPAF